jgi:hypothetical protein
MDLGFYAVRLVQSTEILRTASTILQISALYHSFVACRSSYTLLSARGPRILSEELCRVYMHQRGMPGGGHEAVSPET